MLASWILSLMIALRPEAPWKDMRTYPLGDGSVFAFVLPAAWRLRFVETGTTGWSARTLCSRRSVDLRPHRSGRRHLA